MKVDITNRTELNSILNRLTEDTEALWGVMQPQNMVEHLAMTLEYSNGKKHAPQRTTIEEGQKAKQALINSDMEIPKGLKSPLIPGEGPAPFAYSSLDEAKQVLNKELDDFERFYANNPGATNIQPRLGAMNHEEWIIFHGKHFTHHFKQFGLVD